MISKKMLTTVTFALATLALGSACSNNAQSTNDIPAGPAGSIGTNAAGASLPRSAQDAARSVTEFRVAPAALSVQSGFKVEIIGNVPNARELKVAPNGDLLVGTKSQNVELITNADGTSGSPGAATTLITLPEGPAAGIALGPNNTAYVGTEHAVWKFHYAAGDRTEFNPIKIAALRTGPISGTDGDVHHTTSVALLLGSVYAAVGSSCNACTEVDTGRAAITKMGLNGENPQVYARGVRNAMAFATNPRTFFLWAGGAGQDNLAIGHPYEYFDAITESPAGTSWGWPTCEEHRVAYTPGTDCSAIIAPHVELPAYSTIIGAAFYPLNPTGPYAFPASYRGGLFLSAHGSWHSDRSGIPLVAPQVDYVPMNPNGWDALIPVDWSNPKAQFSQFLGGFEAPGSAMSTGRPTGVDFGPNGSLFIGDDKSGNIYRIRPA